MGERGILVLQLLQIVGKNDASDRALVMRDADRAIDEVTDLLGNAAIATYSVTS